MTVIAQTGGHARAVSWIDTAYTELQGRTRWRWLRGSFTLTTVSGQESYVNTEAIDDITSSGLTRFGEWRFKDAINLPRIYLQATGTGGEYWLTYIPWDQYQAIYRIGGITNSAPSHITISPDNKIHLGPTPDDVYVISGEYEKSAQELTLDADTPEMPSDYHMAIVYLAMEDYGFFNSAEEVLIRGKQKARRMIRRLENNQAPAMGMAGPMV